MSGGNIIQGTFALKAAITKAYQESDMSKALQELRNVSSILKEKSLMTECVREHLLEIQYKWSSRSVQVCQMCEEILENLRHHLGDTCISKEGSSDLGLSSTPNVTAPRSSPQLIAHEAEGVFNTRHSVRTQIYSGRKKNPTIMSLQDLCKKCLFQHIEDPYDFDSAPFDLIEPILRKCSAEQLSKTESRNPLLAKRTDHLWKALCGVQGDHDQLQHPPPNFNSWKQYYTMRNQSKEMRLKELSMRINKNKVANDTGRLTKATSSVIITSGGKRTCKSLLNSASQSAKPQKFSKASPVPIGLKRSLQMLRAESVKRRPAIQR